MKKNILAIVIFALFTSATINACPISKDKCYTVCDDPHEGNNSGHKKFDPEKYQRDLEAYIAKEACLTQQESQAFFPLLREMQQKQRALYPKQKKLNGDIFCDEKAALEAINRHDSKEIEIKKLQQQYHKQFLKVLPATKVLKCILAEDRFNKNLMKNMAK